MIGLKRGTVRLLKHSAAWDRSFKQEKRKLKKVFGKEAVDVQHVGSTAIRDIRAKPVIDIAVTVSS
ncbi:MAG: GrpB family protein, partial [Candidatus Kerfeldbacteria bacterium]|nr:GrpB family protein [Candidatus Kerfeldbacteria bacterium]